MGCVTEPYIVLTADVRYNAAEEKVVNHRQAGSLARPIKPSTLVVA
jgi:hypothetical protein